MKAHRDGQCFISYGLGLGERGLPEVRYEVNVGGHTIVGLYENAESVVNGVVSYMPQMTKQQGRDFVACMGVLWPPQGEQAKKDFKKFQRQLRGPEHGESWWAYAKRKATAWWYGR